MGTLAIAAPGTIAKASYRAHSLPKTPRLTAVVSHDRNESDDQDYRRIHP